MSISDYINKHKKAGTLGQKVPAPSGVVPESADQTTPMVLPKKQGLFGAPVTKQFLSSIPGMLKTAPGKLSEFIKAYGEKNKAEQDQAKGALGLLRTQIKQGARIPIGLAKATASGIAQIGETIRPRFMGESDKIESLKETIYDPLKEKTRQEGSGALESTLLPPLGLVAGFAMSAPGAPGKKKVVKETVEQLGKQTAKSTPVTPAIYKKGSRFAVDTTKVPVSEYIKKNLTGIGAQRKGNEKMLRSFYADQARRQQPPKASRTTEPVPIPPSARTPKPPKPPSTTKTGKFRVPPPGGTKERRFVTSVKKKMPDAEPIQRINGQYVPRSTDELAIKARTLINEDFNKADELRKQDLGDKSVAIASEMIKSLDDKISKTSDVAVKNTLLDKIVDIVEDMAPRLTEAGREIQAASILGRMTPAGFLRFANREIAKANTKRAAGKQIPGLTKEESKALYEKAKRIFEMPDGDDKFMAMKELTEEMRERIPSPVTSKLATIWKAGLLTGLKTTGLNLMSNVAHSGLEIAKDVPAVAADMAISLFTGQRSKGLTTRKWAKGFVEGAKAGWKYWKTGYDPREINRALELKAVRFKSKIIQGYVDTVFRSLSATDQPLYYGALRRSLRDQAIVQAKNEKLTGEAFRKRVSELEEAPEEAMSAIATLDAETAVFINKTTLGKAGKKIQEIPGGEFVVPFARTPSAVAMQVLNYSPVGIMLELRRQIARGTFDQRGLATAIGRSTTGSVPLIWLGTELYNSDMISLDFPITERDRELWKTEGRVPNAVKIGDKWRTLQTLGPAGPVILMGAHYSKALEETGSPSSAIIQAIWGTAKSFSEATFLRGLNDIMQAFTNPAQEGTNWAAGYISSWIPTIINDIARSTDSKERFTSDQSFLKTVMNRVQSRIPGLRQGLQEQVDVLGRDVNRPTGPIANMIDPTRPSGTQATPVTTELRRLTDAGFDVSPTRVGDKFGYDSLTPDQRTELWRNAGELTNRKLTALFANPAYQKLSDEEKTKKAKQFITRSQEEARARMVIEMTKGMSGATLKTELSRLKKDGLLTEAVFAVYKKLRAEQ